MQLLLPTEIVQHFFLHFSTIVAYFYGQDCSMEHGGRLWGRLCIGGVPGRQSWLHLTRNSPQRVPDDDDDDDDATVSGDWA